jgi:hypothetical protein
LAKILNAGYTINVAFDRVIGDLHKRFIVKRACVGSARR